MLGGGCFRFAQDDRVWAVRRRRGGGGITGSLAARARSRFLAALGMTARKTRATAKAKAKAAVKEEVGAKDEADPCGMTTRKARATTEAGPKAKTEADSQGE